MNHTVHWPAVGMMVVATVLCANAVAKIYPPLAGLRIVTPAQFRWTGAPAGAARGTPSVTPGSPLSYAAVEGDPLKPNAPFTIRLKCADGYRIAPHWHPVDENIIVLRGAFAVAVGDAFDPAQMRDIPAGGYGYVPARVHHFAVCKGETEMVMYGVGPRLNYWISAGGH